LHSSLFVFLNQREGYEAHANFFTEKVYMSTMENLCPWMLRYYALSVIIGSKRKSATKELLNEIQSLAHLYSDPITQFVEAIYDRFDFDEAQKLLKLSQEIIKNDFFMQIHADRFIQEARMLICEVYCSINRRVDLNKLTEKLELTQEQAEKWMVDMVQKSTSSAVQDATIDSSSKQVIIAPPSGAGQQHVLERTRDLTVRSGMLTANIDSLLSEQAFYIKHRL
jgi:translation initiation factor 3 subunit E